MADENTTDERSTHNNQSGSVPNCSCWNSACLYPGCECFAASIYCKDSCACENCFNTHEFDDIFEKGQDELLSDNPPARTPNVGDDATQTLADVAEDGTFMNPAESSHIGGCICKNCGCLNPPCGCFMANVGCSGRCGCERCGNPFGRKTESEQRQVEDGYNWRKYGQKLVKGSENPRSYFKCTYPDCLTRKIVERTLDGQITAIVYNGSHNHLKPESTRRSSSSQSMQPSACANSEISDQSAGPLGNPQTESLAMQGDSSASFGDEIEPDAKTWKGEIEMDDIIGTGSRTERAQGIRIQTSDIDIPDHGFRWKKYGKRIRTISDIDIPDDGFRWKQYGNKVLKGNPNPRRYFMCATTGCPARKHVERASHDTREVITTYDGRHNHDVPAARTSGYGLSRPSPPDANNSNVAPVPIRPSLTTMAIQSSLSDYFNFPYSTRLPTSLGSQAPFTASMLQTSAMSIQSSLSNYFNFPYSTWFPTSLGSQAPFTASMLQTSAMAIQSSLSNYFNFPYSTRFPTSLGSQAPFTASMLQTSGSYGYTGFGNSPGIYMNQTQQSDGFFSRYQEEPREDLFLDSIFNSYNQQQVEVDMLQSETGSYGYTGFGNSPGMYMNQTQQSDGFFSRYQEEPREDLFLDSIFNSYNQQQVEVDMLQSETRSNQQQVEADRVESETGSNQQQVGIGQKRE